MDNELQLLNPKTANPNNPRYRSAAEVQRLIDLYFIKEKLHTITGLALFLGFSDRKAFYEYGEKEAVRHVIKKARTRIEAVYESYLHGRSYGGAIFALKNMGWTDIQTIEQTGSVEVRVIALPPKKPELAPVDISLDNRIEIQKKEVKSLPIRQTRGRNKANIQKEDES